MRALLLFVPLLVLSACAPVAPPVHHGLTIVASINVYGDIAQTIAGPDVTVTSVIMKPAQDPHSFEGDAHVQLSLSQADIVIENGGGYDDWMGTLLAGANNPQAIVLNVADISGYKQDKNFNEHLWYDVATVSKLVPQLVTALSKQQPASAATFEANGNAFIARLAALEARQAEFKEAHAGIGVAITEPVPLYLLTACGLTNVTPPAFSKAIEDGTDVSPSVLASTLTVFSKHNAALLVYNKQTTGSETTRVLEAAKKAKVPVVAVTETMPAGQNYLAWMASLLDAIAAAL